MYLTFLLQCLRTWARIYFAWIPQTPATGLAVPTYFLINLTPLHWVLYISRLGCCRRSILKQTAFLKVTLKMRSSNTTFPKTYSFITAQYSNVPLVYFLNSFALIDYSIINEDKQLHSPFMSKSFSSWQVKSSPCRIITWSSYNRVCVSVGYRWLFLPAVKLCTCTDTATAQQH